MEPAEDIKAVTETAAPRRAWKAPNARRLATSAAEAGSTISFDGLEIPS
jgi:hypothetical protein